MAESDHSAVKRVAELFKRCRARYRESYPNSLVDFDLLDLTKKIEHTGWAHARGHFSDVYKGTMDAERVVAVKTLRLPVYDPHDDKIYRNALLRFFREVHIWSTLNHPNVAPCLGYTLAGANLSIISPWYDKGNLVQFLRASGDASGPDLILDVAEGTQYLHTCSNPLVHGDLKGANILVSENGMACLADFGISKQIDDMNRNTGFTTTSGVKGTLPWMAPELEGDSSLTFPCDVYSCAGVFLEICCPGKTPFHYLSRDSSLVLAKSAGTVPDLREYPEMAEKMALWEIMCACWAHDPLRRPSIATIVQSLYSLFKLTPRVNQTVTLRPPVNSVSRDNVRSTKRRFRVASGEFDLGQNAPAEASFKRQKLQKITPGLGHLAAEQAPQQMGEPLRRPTGQSYSLGSTAQGAGPTMKELMAMELKDIPAEHLKQGDGWHAIVNPHATRALDISLVVTLNHDSHVQSIELSPDGKYLAVGSDRIAYVYHTRTGEKAHTLLHGNLKNKKPKLITNLAFSPNGELVATAAPDNKLVIWDLAEGTIRNVLKGSVYSVAFSPDGRRIAIASLGPDDGRIWDWHAGTIIALSPTPTECGIVVSVAFSPDGLLVAGKSTAAFISIWNAETGCLIGQLKGHRGTPCSAEFTPDSKGIISGGQYNTVKRWSLETLLSTFKDKITGLPEEAILSDQKSAIQEERGCITTYLGLQPEGWYVVTSSNEPWAMVVCKNGELGIWDIGHPAAPQLMLSEHASAIRSARMSTEYAPGTLGGFLASRRANNTVRIWRYTYV